MVFKISQVYINWSKSRMPLRRLHRRSGGSELNDGGTRGTTLNHHTWHIYSHWNWASLWHPRWSWHVAQSDTVLPPPSRPIGYRHCTKNSEETQAWLNVPHESFVLDSVRRAGTRDAFYVSRYPKSLSTCPQLMAEEGSFSRHTLFQATSR